MTPTQKEKKVSSILRKLGFRFDSKEVTEGARKTWWKPGSIELAHKELRRHFEVTPIEREFWDEKVFFGPGFEVRRVFDDIEGIFLFVAIYAGPRAKEYARGLDV